MKSASFICRDFEVATSDRIKLAFGTSRARKILVPIHGNLAQVRDKIAQIKSTPHNDYVEIVVQLWLREDSETPIFIGDLNATIDLFITVHANAITFEREVKNVRKLTCINPNQSISNFICLRELDIVTENRDLLQLVIKNNQETLQTLKMNNVYGWNYTIPCQLKEIHLRDFSDSNSLQDASEILASQRHLRTLSLAKTMINKNLLEILVVNEILNKIEFKSCDFQLSAVEFLNKNRKAEFPVQHLLYEDKFDDDFHKVFRRQCKSLTRQEFVRCKPAIE